MENYRLSHFLWKHHVPFIPKIIKALNYFFFHCIIPPECEIGQGTILWHHGHGIIIHPNTYLGKFCNIYNHVVIGGGNDSALGRPTKIHIEDNVTIGAGAKVLCRKSPLVIGSNSLITANSVVIKDVPKNAVVGGIPAKILKMKVVK